ncbi:MAG: hypothetical protein Kow0077_24130 [Anaerolineae bacterium]
MSTNFGQAIIRGIPNRPDVNVRAGPGTLHELLFKLPVGATAEVIDALPDSGGNHFQGKVYQWLKLRLPDGRTGWVRDDLLDLAPGDHSAIGYPRLGVRTFAFTLWRDESQRPPQPPETPVERIEIAEDPAPAPEAPPEMPLFIPASEMPAPEAPLEPPAEAPAPPVETLPEAPPHAPDIPDAPDAGCSAVVIGARTAINVRSGPSTAHAVVTRLERGTRLPVLEARPQEDGGPFRWARVAVQDRDGWIREDLLSFAGAGCAEMGLLPASDLYPAPMALPAYWWVRGFEGPLPQHTGWDLGAEQGEPVLAGPQGGTVVIAFNATKATPERPSIRDHGWRLGDPRVFSDPGWGFGYGHYVIVRYLHEQLPAYTREQLANRGFSGGAVYVMYAHLHTREVFQGQALTPGQPIGTCGNTGNSEAPHLHLEIRASRNPNETSWARLKDGLLDPGILFAR